MDILLQQERGKALRTKDLGLVSVVMPNYNGKDYIRQAISSVLSQTYSNWELLIVDDCSTDASADIVGEFDDARIKLIRNQKNSGAAVSRNRAIELCSGKWIAFLDSDDTWEPDKLERHLTFMDEGEHAFSFTSYAVVNSDDELVAEFAPKRDFYDYKTILKHCYIGCSTVIYNQEMLGKVNMPTNAPKREDFACWLHILKSGVNAACLHETLTTYRVHARSVSSNKLKMIKYQWAVYRRVEGLSVVKSLYYMAHWAILGVLKYR